MANDAKSQVTTLSRDASGTEFVANSFFDYDDIGRLKQLTYSMDASEPGRGLPSLAHHKLKPLPPGYGERPN